MEIPPYPAGISAPPNSDFVISKIAFRYRFTDEEFISITQAAKTDFVIGAWLETYNMTSTVDLSDRRMIPAFDSLQAKGILSEVRIIEIVSAPIRESERP